MPKMYRHGGGYGGGGYDRGYDRRDDRYDRSYDRRDDRYDRGYDRRDDYDRRGGCSGYIIIEGELCTLDQLAQLASRIGMYWNKFVSFVSSERL